MVAIVAPGQGAQSAGFLNAWLELPGVADGFGRLSEAAGFDLAAAGSTADADHIRNTAVAQPLLVASGLVVAERLFGGDLDGVSVAAGHSVGELTAAGVVGCLPDDVTVGLAAERGRAMAAAAGETPGGMVAVLGGDPEAVVAHLGKLGLTVANHNGNGQFVTAGSEEALQRLAADPPSGSRLRRLAVAGAFHTPLMESARDQLAAWAADLAVRDPEVPILSNADGAPMHTGPEILGRLIAQVAGSVRWDRCMQTLAQLGVRAVIELPPAGTLTGILRRALPDVECLPLRSPDDLAAARRLLAESGPAHPDGDSPLAMQVVVAPHPGTFHAMPLHHGSRLGRGTPVGSVVSGRETTRVGSPHDGVLAEWLVHDGDPVRGGQVLARVEPEGALR